MDPIKNSFANYLLDDKKYPTLASPLTSLFSSIKLSQEADHLSKLMCAPEYSWELQNRFKELIKKGLTNHPSNFIDIICCEPGYLSIEGEWVLPKYKEIAFTELNKYPSYEGVYFTSPEIISAMHHLDIPPSQKVIKELFKAAKHSSIPWNLNHEGAEGNSNFLYKMFISMGVPSCWITKFYCIGNTQFDSSANKSEHAALSIQDDKGIHWVFDPAVSPEKPIKVAHWAKKISRKELHKSWISEFPFKMDPQFNYLCAVKGLDYLKPDLTNHTINPPNNSVPLLSFLPLSLAINTILKNSILSDTVRLYLPASRNRLDSIKAEQQIALRKLTNFTNLLSQLPPTPNDILNLNSKAFFNVRKLDAIIINYHQSTFNKETAEYKIEKAKFKADQMLDIVDSMFPKCLQIMESANFSKEQLEKMKKAQTEALMRLQRANAQFAKYAADKLLLLS